MSAVRVRILLLAIASLLFVDRAPTKENAARDADDEATATNRANKTFDLATAKAPVRFEANAGQMDERVRFVARAKNTALALAEDGALVAVDRSPPRRRAHDKGASKLEGGRASIALKVAGGRAVAPVGSAPVDTVTNYYVGDRARWRANVPSYSKVTYPSVLDGVDLVYHGENGYLEYDFVVAPGANVDAVAMNVKGGDVTLTSNGDLAIHTSAGDVIQPRPTVYQRDANGDKRTIASSYRVVDSSKVGFVVAAYDKTRELVIDPPVPGFATYLGGSDDEAGYAVATDGLGNTYVTGDTFSFDFPLVNAADSVIDSCNDNCLSIEAFVTKLNPQGTGVTYSTYLGGAQSDTGWSIAVDSQQRAYVVGETHSFDFPVFPIPQQIPQPDQPMNTFKGNGTDGFVTRLTSTGALSYSTYLAGDGEDYAYGVVVDNNFNAIVTGSTNSPTLTEVALRQAAVPDGFNFGPTKAYILKLNATGTALVAGTTDPTTIVRLIGSTDESYAVAADGNGNYYITGYTYEHISTLPAFPCPSQNEDKDAFVAKVANDLSTSYIACVGGLHNEYGHAVVANAAGDVFFTGGTQSPDFPTTNGSYQPSQLPDPGAQPRFDEDAFVVGIKADASGFLYSTRYGRENQDSGYAIALDSTGTVWIAGETSSPDLPELNAVQNGFAGTAFADGPGTDGFIARFNATGSNIGLASYLGGDGRDSVNGLAIRGTSIHLVGTTSSTVTGNGQTPNPKPLPSGAAAPGPFQANNGGGNDGYVARFDVPPLVISPPTVVVNVGGSQLFVAAGGIGAPYTFSISTNNSGGSISPAGIYSAGAVGNVTDIVTVADAAGLTANATVQVGAPPPDLILAPVSATVPPKGTKNFSVSGGVPPYTWALASNGSGGSVFQNGVYTAGATGSVVDVVRVTDSAGASRTATVQVTGPLKITPPSPSVAPKGTVDFLVSGGSGGGYVWSLSKNTSGGTIGPASGKYTAGPGTNAVDTISVTDSLGNKASVNVSVGGGIAITPAEPTTTTRGTVEFTAVGGSNAFTWAITTNASGGTIDPNTGVYIAGTVGNVIDTVKVTDSVGNSATVGVTVGPALTIDPIALTVLTGETRSFNAAGGSGVYSFALIQNQSGGTITPDGTYSSGATAGTDIVRLSDSLGSTADAAVTVNARPTQTQPPATTPPGFDGGTFNGINIGGGGNDDCGCRVVGGVSTNESGRALAGLALALGLVIRRRRRH